jgi:hypothetical protein
MNPGLLLLFFISVGTIVFPVLTSIVLRSDLLSIWALQGLFLFISRVTSSLSFF